ncbi:MAG TPA: outer membrane protein assembly factor BamA, partial [Spirochaetota bacterium]|nr:outer membrane protein assembly factor BamA [Spirochaetota bacterium]
MKFFKALPPAAFLALLILSFLFFKESGYTIPSEYEDKIIKRIEFVGVSELEDGTVEYGQVYDKSYDDLLELCSSYVGEPLKSDIIQADIKALAKNANMMDVKVYVSEYDGGVIVKYYCKEGPTVGQIEFRGSEKIKTDDILVKLPFRESEPFQQSLVEAGSSIILNHLIQEKGAFNATVRYEIKRLEGKRNSKKVIYFIDDGEEVNVGRITLLGINKVYDHQLRSMMQTKSKNLLNSGEFKRDQFEQDKMRLIYFYRSLGYLDADIVEENTRLEWKNPEITEDRELYITLKFKEGERYYFEGYSLEGNVLVPTEKITSQFSLKKEKDPSDALADKIRGLSGDLTDDDVVFDEMKFQQDRSVISYEYSIIGHVFARVVPVKTVIEREKKIGNKTVKRKYVSYNFKIFEGKPVDVENIIIKGNKKTKEKIIRRQILVKEGKKYNQKYLDISRERIYAMGFFKEVNVDIRPGSSDEKVNLIFTVLEQPTGNINMGGGIGSSTGFAITAAVAENNFRGLAQKVEIKVEYGAERISSSLSYSDPYVFDSPVGFSASVFYSLYQVDSSTPYFDDLDDNDEYRQRSFGYSTGLSYSFMIYNGVGIRWRHSFKKITDAAGNCSDETFKIKALGIQEKRVISLNLYHNSTDHSLLTTKGLNLDFETMFVGGAFLGGQDHYIEQIVSAAWYYSPFSLPYLPKNKCVIELRASGDFISPPLNKSKVS